MPTDLRLSGAIPGLLRRGSPVTKTWLMDNDFDSYDSVTVSGVVLEQLEDDEAGERWSCWFFDERIGRDTGFAPDLDITDPTGRFHALLWLRERGHDLRWAENEAEVLAWSVLSVARGGDVIRAIDDVPRFVNTRCSLAQFAGASFWWCATAEDRDFFVGPDGKHHGWYFAGMFGPETGDAAIQIVCAHALADRCALRNEDGLLTLPELPEVTRV